MAPLHPHDFEAVIRILTAKAGGRRTLAHNGIRWDFAYVEHGPYPPMLYMIWPEFTRPDGQPFPVETPLPVGPELSARMRIVSEEMRVEVHRKRIEPGVRFYCHEGPIRDAEGTVTRITGLFEDLAGGG